MNSFDIPLHIPVAPDNELLLVWDAPNLDMGLGAILGGRPNAAHRPRFDAVGKWLLAKAGELSHTTGIKIEAETTVFANITPGGADNVRPWVEALRNIGFAVFAKPKLSEETDVDPDMLAHIRLRHQAGKLKGLVVASADGQNFKDTLDELAAEGVAVTVLGFHEHASWAVADEALTFVDLEEVPGVFRDPLPRVSLDKLPDEGAWLQPFRPLTALLSNR
ncbi:NYN domain-containing protein [Corynebacterium pseudotuberculosis]|uniref:NYN domain-containing protein n=1 Tax=Corynebacterium pseudotuberculosis TaxID=1719 RepID=UPI00351844AD